MSEFSLHEIVVGCYFINRQIYNGVECEIVGELKERTISIESGKPCNPTIWLCYRVVFSDGFKTCVGEKNLRKKKPPQEELKTWEQLKKDLDMSEEIAHA